MDNQGKIKVNFSSSNEKTIILKINTNKAKIVLKNVQFELIIKFLIHFYDVTRKLINNNRGKQITK